MDDHHLTLARPSEGYEEAYLDYLSDFERAGEVHPHTRTSPFDFKVYLDQVRNSADGVGLPEGWVPSEAYWLAGEGRILGEGGLRHPLTQGLRDFGGNIWQGVRPSERGKGYGTLMLVMLLEKARMKDLRRVLITCASTNVASARVIRKNRGVLDSETWSPRPGRATRRYWVNL